MALVLRIHPTTREVAFVWTAVDGATSYVLYVGVASGAYGIYSSNVGNVLTYPLDLINGTYYSRVAAYGAGGYISQTDEQVVTL